LVGPFQLLESALHGFWRRMRTTVRNRDPGVARNPHDRESIHNLAYRAGSALCDVMNAPRSRTAF
jgi:hypothetical protein